MNRLFASALACLALLWSPMADAKLPERPDGPVYDGASIIPDDVEAEIETKLRALSKATGKTVVVATVTSLDGNAIEEYATKLYEIWGVGDQVLDEGALILVAPNERRTRIEVGYGSEGILPDALTGRIIEQQMIPQFKDGNYGGGISAGADAITEQLEREPTDAKAIAATAERSQRQSSKGDEGEFGIVIFWLLIFFFFVMPSIMSAFRGGKKYRGKRRREDDDDDDNWGGPVVIWGGSGSSWSGSSSSGWSGGGFGGFGGGMSGGGGASGGW